MSLELDRNISINGHTFKKGKDVDTKRTEDVNGKTVAVDYADGIKEVLLLAQNGDAAIEKAKQTDPLGATKLSNSETQATVSEPVAPVTNPKVAK